MPTSPPTTLDTTPLCELLAHARQRRLSGTLQLDPQDSAQRVIVLREGVITKLGGPGASSRLGSLLLSSGVIAREQLASALKAARRSGTSLGSCLITMGHATAEKLEEALTAQRRLRLRELCKLPRRTTFRFLRGVDELAPWQPFASDMLRDLWLCVQAEAPTQRVEALRKTLGTRRLSLSSPDALAAWRFSRPELACLEPLQAGCSLSELARHASKHDTDTQRTYLCVYALVLARTLVVAEATSRQSASAPSLEPHSTKSCPAEARPAEAHTAEARPRHTSSSPSANPDTPEACSQRALQAIRRQRLDTALQIVIEGRKLFSQDAALRGCHAWLRACLAPAPTRASTAEESLFELNLCIHKCPTDLSLRRYRADLLRRMSRTEEAVIDLALIARNDPEDLDAQRELRLFKLRRNKSQRPRSSWSRLVLWR